MYSEKDICLRLNCNFKKPNTCKLPFLCTKEIKLRDSKARKSCEVLHILTYKQEGNGSAEKLRLSVRFFA